MSNIEKISFVGFLLLALLAGQVPAAQEDFYDETVLRTLELEFSQSDWWNQLEDNYQAGENIIAALTVDGVTYEDVGVRFHEVQSTVMEKG